AKRPGGDGILQRGSYLPDHPVEIVPDVGIEKPKGAKPLPGENGVADRVVPRAGQVGRAIDLDDQPAPETYEVQVVTSQGSLAAEMETLRAQGAERDPQSGLGRRHSLPHVAGLGDDGHGPSPPRRRFAPASLPIKGRENAPIAI